MHKPNLPMWMALAAMATTYDEPTVPASFRQPVRRTPTPKPAPLPPADPDAIVHTMAISPHETRAQRRERLRRADSVAGS